MGRHNPKQLLRHYRSILSDLQQVGVKWTIAIKILILVKRNLQFM